MASRPRHSLLPALAATLAFAPTATAQVATRPPAAAAAEPAPGTPAACSKAAADWRTAQVSSAREAYQKATDANRAELLAALQAANRSAFEGFQRKAAECAAGFDIATIPAGQLMDLVALYNAAQDTSGARRATERLLTATDLPPRAHGQALLMRMNQEVAAVPTYFGIIAGAERYVREIDALPDSLADLKLAAHRSMLGRYEYLDVADGLRDHATAVIALGRRLKATNDILSGYASLARSYADRLHPDSALAILDGAEREFGAAATRQFEDFRHRYALIGTKAPQISATWWINTADSTVVAPKPGRVSLIEFTAHWCGPCKNSYPGLVGLNEKLKGKAFDGYMVTSLYGYIGTRQKLTQEEEIEADREYFGKEHALPFPVAINPPVKQVPGSFAQPKPDSDYRVGGIPQIILVDKRGIIRQIVTGWDQGNTARFAAFIDRLLAEPGPDTP